MCYTVTSLEEKSLNYAIHLAEHFEDRERLRNQLERLREKYRHDYHNISGFDHPDLICITAEGPTRLNWGLVPFWVKDELTAVTLRRSTLNARGETIFEKPSFRGPAKDRRCIVLLQGFYEYHHANKRTYPFHVKLKNQDTMILAGLWDHNEAMGRSTVSIVTTAGNELLSKIHNNPKLKGPRMPVILSLEESRIWVNSNPDEAKSLIKPYANNDLIAYTVPPIKGKQAIGNIPESREEFIYEDLEF